MSKSVESLFTIRGLKHLFIKLGACRRTRRIVPIHSLTEVISDQLVRTLPAIHALTGCDTTSKVGSKTGVLKKSLDLELLELFGQNDISDQMIRGAERFLLQLLGNEDLKTFDIHRHQQFYDSKKNLTLQKIVCCSMFINPNTSYQKSISADTLMGDRS